MIGFGVILNFLHYLLNRFIIIPLGFIAGFGWWTAFFIAFGMDIVQMFAYFYFLEGAGVNKKVGRLIAKRFPSQNKVARTKMVIKLRHFGYLGVTVLAGLPVYMGGMYSAVLVSHLMHLNRKKSYLCLTMGSFIGSGILILGIRAIWILIKSIII